MEKLKPCPLCGGKAINRVVEKTTVSDYYGIVCTVCNCRTAGYLDLNKAIKAWNRRANNEPTAYDLDKVVEQLEKESQTSASAKSEAIIGMCGASANHYDGEECAYKRAIEIVKGGGVDAF